MSKKYNLINVQPIKLRGNEAYQKAIIYEIEVWVPCKGFEDYFLISTTGFLRNIKSWRIVKSTDKNKYGHQSCCLYTDGIKHAHERVHKLMMLTFVGLYPKGMQIRHLDGNPRNNCLRNLAYGTPKQNGADKILHGTNMAGEKNPKSKLNSQQVIRIRQLRNSLTIVEIASRFDISTSNVFDIVHRNIWKHI